MNDELILHHYPTSPFAQKARMVLGAKQLAWRSVHIPVVMPKPDVVALTGGYRRTPFLQIGADVYCDTALICKLLDARAPEPPLYPAASAGTAQMRAQWADTTLFWTAVPYALQPAGAPSLLGNGPPEVLKAFAADRAAMNPNFRRPTVTDATAALHTYLGWLESHLGDSGDYMAGSELSIADFSVAHCLWFIKRAPPVASILDGHPKLGAWHERILAIGHGASSPMTSAEAIEVAARVTTHAPATVESGLGFEPGEPVSVTPTDYGYDPVAGTLVGLSGDSVTLEREDPRAGRVHVHFPRLGFQIKKDGKAAS